MRKQSHLKKAVSLAVAAAMAVAVCTTALAEDVTDVQNEGAQTEETAEQSTEENTPVVLSGESSDIAVQAVTPNAEGQYEVKKSGDIVDVLESQPDTKDFTFVLSEGNFSLYGCKDSKGQSIQTLTQGKNLTFIGQGRDKTAWNIGAEVPDPDKEGTEYNGDYSFDNAATVTFQHMKMISAEKDYLGFIRPDNTVVIDCEVTGATHYWGYDSATFKDSTFTCPDGRYVITMYSSNVLNFENCEFNGSGKILNLYREKLSSAQPVTVNVTNCTVNSTKANKSFININDAYLASQGQTFRININNTTINGLTENEFSGSNIFGFSEAEKNGGKTDIYVDGVLVWQNGQSVAPVEINPGTAVAPAEPAVDDSALATVTDTELKDALTTTANSASLSTEGEAGKALTENATVTKMLDDAKATYTTDKELKDAINTSSDSADATELKNADAADIKLVATPYLAVKPLADSTKQQLSFDIKLYTVLKATTNPNNMTAANTCTLGAPVEVKDAPTTVISLDVGSAFSGDDLYTLYVKHVTESGDVHFYGTKTDANNPGVITFENKHGFSTFTVLSSKESAVVQIGDQTLTYDLAAVGTEFPYTAVEGFDFAGYYFDGIEGCYTTLTEDLFHQLAAAGKGKAVASQPRYTPKAGTVTPAPSEEPKPSEAPTPAPTAAPAAAPAATAAPTPTATPDDSQYYTCTACGHHDWTATADGYKCNTCGHLETKQISGYKNVKGVYTPTASSAKAAAAKATTIPQTSDEMPIVPIAIVAIAALMGLGVTVYMKKKQN